MFSKWHIKTLPNVGPKGGRTHCYAITLFIKISIKYKKQFKHGNFKQTVKQTLSQTANMCLISVKLLHTKV